MLKTSVIICTYNRERYLPTCLAHLKQQTAPRTSFEIVLVNNNSSDLTDSICLAFQAENPQLNLTYVIESNPGLSYARNRGITESKGEMVCFIDDDGFAYPDYIENLHKELEKNRAIEAFGGRIFPRYEEQKPKWLSKWLMPLLSVLDKGNSIRLFKGRDYPIGANMGCKRSILLKAGAFNTELGRKGTELLGGEEKDFFFKVKKMNIPVFYLPNVTIDHIIPDQRLTVDYIKRMANGIGRSEQIRTKNKSFSAYTMALISELMKWFVTLLLSIYYVFFHWEKSWMLLRFRFWVTKGLLVNRITLK
jgi:glycosyltransferase involved in cell wall biosynthesis